MHLLLLGLVDVIFLVDTSHSTPAFLISLYLSLCPSGLEPINSPRLHQCPAYSNAESNGCFSPVQTMRSAGGTRSGASALLEKLIGPDGKSRLPNVQIAPFSKVTELGFEQQHGIEGGEKEGMFRANLVSFRTRNSLLDAEGQARGRERRAMLAADGKVVMAAVMMKHTHTH